MAQQDIDFKTHDRRLVDRLIKRGELSEKEVEKALKQLPDAAAESTTFESKFERDAANRGQG